MKNLPVAIKGTNKPLCLFEIFFASGFRSRYRASQITRKTEEMVIFGNSSAVPLLLWLLVVPFFNQVEGNNPVSSNSSKVSLLT